MAVKFVRSSATGAGTGADWTNAITTLAAALTASSAGDTIWVADDHAETQASAMTLTSPGTAANPVFIYCVDHTVSSPGAGDLKMAGSVTTTGASAITVGGSFYCYGLTLSAGSGANSVNMTLNSTASHIQKYERCSLQLAGTTGGSVLLCNGNNGAKTQLRNLSFKFASLSHGIIHQGRVTWRNDDNFGAAVLGTIPAILFKASSGNQEQLQIEGVDLSALGSGKTLVGAMTGSAIAVFKDCKFGASVTVAATPTAPGGIETFVSRSDSAATNYRQEKYGYAGTQVVETTVVRVGGASDGTTPLSWKISTSANSRWVAPFEAIPIAIWNEKTSGNLTVTVEGIWSGGAPGTPNNDDIWMDVEYLGSASSPQGSIESGSKANNLAAGVALPSSTNPWGSSPATPTAFKMSSTFAAPAQKGLIYVYVKAAKASTTFYVDPLVSLS